MVYEIQKLSNRHEAIMRYMIANPTLSIKEVAAKFDVTSVWLSAIVHSDVFQARYNELRDKLDGATILPLRDKLVGIANAAADKLMEQMENIDDPKFIKETMNDTLKALGYGAKGPTNVFLPGAVQNNNTVSADVLHAAQAKRARLQYHEVSGLNDHHEHGKPIVPTPDGQGFIVPPPPITPKLDVMLEEEARTGEIASADPGEYNKDGKYRTRYEPRKPPVIEDLDSLFDDLPSPETSPGGDV